MSTPLRILIAILGLTLLAIGVFAVFIAITFGMLNAARNHLMVLLAVAIFALIGGVWLMFVAWMGGRRRPASDGTGGAPPRTPAP